MFSAHKDSAEYVPLATHQDEDSSDDGNVTDSARPNSSRLTLPSKSRLSPFILWASVVVAALSTLNFALIPWTMSAYELSETQLAKLPYPDLHVGFNRIDKLLHNIVPRPFIHSWPEHIVRINEGLKDTVYGSGNQVFISVKDSTIMKFPIPEGTRDQACVIGWQGPVETREQDLNTKGDISEIEVWSVIAPSSVDANNGVTMDSFDFDSISWNTRPVRGELLGTLDLKGGLILNATTVKFGCPTDSKSLVVELRCVRVDCHVDFAQIEEVRPRMGFELLRQIP
ncbi:hypothetical protein K435DRAFT_964836 [Dendrothele bispora CBS 962.96]|uniref:Ubiquitin 3 binding protein But2 C-terminal domain-containing protein n=1 Tax=Dendrothele bispora (strain CBS 962.96) TaxID=1314807 RepID=A0A4S8M8B6_DENBC|nr:hypothetical protein K435DRAFT_964836 [Dendrothele bispora CBS 962.96]